VRTGYSSFGSTTPGIGNCSAWSSSSGSDFGTYAWWSADWTVAQDVHVWQVDATTCDQYAYVWCVENYPSLIYLPLILKNY
jgi:hypothetical protein